MPKGALRFAVDHRTHRLVLIVASESDCQNSLRDALDAQFDIMVADTGAGAMEIIAQHRDEIGLVLFEFDLPDMSGTAFLQHMGSDPLLARIPVIAMSGDRRMEVEALNNGAMDFLSDPCGDALALRTRALHAIEVSESINTLQSAERDQLTGLYNKDFFFQYVEQYDAFHRDMDTDAIVINISHFHMINERYGKGYGDDVLRHISRKLDDYFSAIDGIVCRRDADTFLAYCPHSTDYSSVLKTAISGLQRKVRLRMGIYPCVDKKLDVIQRFDRAKLASDRLRNTFNKTVAFYDEQLHKSEIYVEQLLDDFPRAIAEKQFVVYYQPKFEIQSTMPVLNSAEALVRWIHPQFGLISPGDFIPLFESNGLIQQLDSYVWRETAAQMRDWKQRLGFCVPVSVNVSRVDIFDYDLVGHMKRLVKEFDLSPDEFLLEITESAYTQDSKQIVETVTELRKAGFHIEVDDFGSGYSSLNMISTLPMDALKLDMEFMRNAFKERKNTKMLDAVIDIAYSLDVPTIAEGVENAEQMFALKEMGCDIVQGYYFSKPVPAEEYERFLVERKRSLESEEDAEAREKTVKPADQFAYEALHDPLTGLYNHSAYKILLKDADQRNIALLIANVFNHDQILEEHGSDIADQAATVVADVLHHNFRSVDFICRIATDEYAIIMTRVNSSMRKLIDDKMVRINAMLRERGAHLPEVELCVGCAFADRENPQGDIFEDADVALARVKATGHGGWEIY